MERITKMKQTHQTNQYCINRMVNHFTELNAKTERKQKVCFPEDTRTVERSFYEDET